MELLLQAVEFALFATLDLSSKLHMLRAEEAPKKQRGLLTFPF